VTASIIRATLAVEFGAVESGAVEFGVGTFGSPIATLNFALKIHGFAGGKFGTCIAFMGCVRNGADPQ